MMIIFGVINRLSIYVGVFFIEIEEVIGKI